MQGNIAEATPTSSGWLTVHSGRAGSMAVAIGVAVAVALGLLVVMLLSTHVEIFSSLLNAEFVCAVL